VDRRSLTAASLAAAILLGGCSRGPEGQGGAGQGGQGATATAPVAGGEARLVAAGLVRSLLASADGAWLAWLEGCQELQGRFLPPGTASCDLVVARADGGEPVRVARGVSTLPHAVLTAPSGGAFAALAGYDHASGAGELVLVRDGAARTVAEGVTFAGFLPGGALLAVAKGALVAVGEGGAARPIPGGEGVASFSTAPPPLQGRAVAVLARRPAAAGGALLALGADLARAEPIAAGTLDYALGAGGAYACTAGRPDRSELWAGGPGAPVRLASGAQAFAFSPDGTSLAWIGAAAPGRPGDLFAGGVGAGQAAPVRLGAEVGEHRWAAAGGRLAWLERYDQGTRTGALAAARPGGPVRRLGRAISAFELAPDGRAIAYLRHTTQGGYSVDLELASLEGEPGPARTVARGVFGFAFSPDGRWLLYRTRCTRQAEACDLERVPAAASPQAAGGAAGIAAAVPAPELLAQGMKSFEFDPRNAGRLLLTWQRTDSTALDAGVWQGRLVALDQGVLPGSLRLLGPDSRRVAYAVVQPRRAGVRVAVLPAP